jgi:carbamoyltransferase
MLKNMLIKNDLVKYFGAAAKNIKIEYINHHLAHAANAFYSSGYEDAAILVVDGLGDNFDSITVWKGKGREITRIKQIKFPHSIGALYLSIVLYLGFSSYSGPGKVMGLASYGQPRFVDDFRKLVMFGDNGDFMLNLSELRMHLNGNNNSTSLSFHDKFGPPRKKGEKIQQQHIDIAYALQKITEDIFIHLGKFMKKAVKSENLCIAGGVGLNCVANGALANSGMFKKIFVSAAPHDAGTSLGAAQYISNRLLKLPLEKPNMDSQVYLGPGYGEEEILRELQKHQEDISYERFEDPTVEAAKLIAAGNIVGWFQGRLEFGPRALGARSILADPRNQEMKDILNKKIKFREDFRPFAPAVMEEYAGDYFVEPASSPFMSFACNVRSDKQLIIPAVTHVDGTARIQTVKKSESPIFYKVIEEFYRLTQVPMVINTSFNIKDEPMCCSPKDAVQCLMKTGMDCLIIGNFIVKKNV